VERHTSADVQGISPQFVPNLLPTCR